MSVAILLEESTAHLQPARHLADTEERMSYLVELAL